MLPQLSPKTVAVRQSKIIEDRSREYTFDSEGNAVDYFNIYKKKMYELAHQRFDEEKDVHFFSYLDRLVNADSYR